MEAAARLRPLATFLRAYQLDGGYTPGPLLALMTGAGVIGSLAIFARRRKGADGTRQPGRTDRPLAAAATIATLSAVAVVLGADVFEFSWRYVISYRRWSRYRSPVCSGIWSSRAAPAAGWRRIRWRDISAPAHEGHLRPLPAVGHHL